MLSASYLAKTHVKISLSSRCRSLVLAQCENMLRLSCYLWNLGSQGNFCKKLVVVNVGNEVSVAVTAQRTPVDRAEVCVQGQGGNDPAPADRGCL